MSETSQKIPLGGLARKLIQIGLLNEETACSITESSIKQRIPFVSALVEEHYIDPEVLGTACSHEFGIPFLDLNAFDTQHIPTDIINQDLVVQYHALPIFRRGNRLYVAISDPTNLKAVDEIRYQTNTNTEAILIAEHKFNELIQKVLSASSEKSLGSLEDVDLEGVDIINGDDAEKSSKTTLGTDAEDAPVVRFINKVILDAVNLGASDLHFEPYEKTYRIRFRRDGILYENSTPPVNISNRFSARLKVMARLDISERRVPQDGRFKMRISSSRTIDFRVSTCPTLFGEKVVMRVLDPSSAKLGIDALGYE
ncbi:MAG TPA: ATPase, T2SS/T4P/T4SS family, partial [Gammaproteobacteria bacterium]|nr:ATPase, T2SS/T4P/T4SS family [Gammaproteobacteria bacterium]